MKQDTRKFYTVFNQILAGYLMQRGFVLMAIAPNRDGSGQNVFHFCNSTELKAAIADYKQHHNATAA